MIERDIIENKVLSDFYGYEKSRGKSTGWIKCLKSDMKTFSVYLEREGLDYRYLNVRNAQAYQGWLLSPADCGYRYAGRSVSAKMSSVKAFYEYLKGFNLAGSNPFCYTDKLREEKKVPGHLPREKEMDLFLEKLSRFEEENHLKKQMSRYKSHVIAELLYSTGMRIGEIGLLKESDIDLARGTVKITGEKTGHERTGFLNEYAKEVLRIYMEEMRKYCIKKDSARQEYLFGRDGNHLSEALRSIFKKVEPKGCFTPHVFRHSAGYHLLRSGCDIRYIQSILGHREISSTQIYTRVDKEDLKEVLDRYHPRSFKSMKD